MPLDVFAYGESFLVLCDNGIYGYNYSGASLSGASFSGMKLKYAAAGENSVVCAGQINTLGTENRILVVGTDGSLLYDHAAEMRITGIYAPPSPEKILAYIRTPAAVIELDADGNTQLHDPAISDILTVLPTGNGAVICGKSSAYTAFED